MKKKGIFTGFFTVLSLLFSGAAYAGSLGSASAPGATNSFRLEAIYSRLNIGATGAQSIFTEPGTDITAGTGHTVNENMDIASATANADKASNDKTAKTKGKDNADEKLRNINPEHAKEFWSYWGVGLVLNIDCGNNKPVKNANIIDGTVRVEEDDDVKYGLGLEVHKFLWGRTWQNRESGDFSGGLVIGPYVSLLPSPNDIFDVIGAGVMFGFHGGKKNSFSMNIGIGCYVDPGTKILDSGFKDGEAPPGNETSVRFKTVTQYGFQSVLSFSYVF